MGRPAKTTATTEPWERRPGESEAAFAAFRAFVALDERTPQGAAQAVGKTRALTHRWSVRWEWAERARGIDNHKIRVEQEARDRVAAKTAAEWERRRLAEREANYKTAVQLRDKALAMLELPMVSTKTKDGKTVITPAKWTFATVSGMLRTASDLGAAATTADEDDGFDPYTATLDELRAWVERKKAREKARREVEGGS